MRCPVHLERNLESEFKIKLLPGMSDLYWAARQAVTRGSYLRCMILIKAHGADGILVHDYLEKVENWQLYIVIEAGNVLHCFRSNNLSEAVFAWTKEARLLSPYLCIKKILRDTIALIFKQRERAMAWTSFVTPHAQILLTEEFDALTSQDSARRLEVSTIIWYNIVVPSELHLFISG
jgi:hypothetical protein